MAHDVFISHSSKDKTTADAICHSLEQNGIRCWIAPRDVRGGHTYATEIIEGIEGCSVMVLVFSKNSNISEDVANEIQNAFSNGKAIIPYRLDDTKMTKEMQYFLSRKHWIEAYPNDKVFTELVTEVKKSLGKGDVSVAPPPPPLTTRPKWLIPTVAAAAVLVVCVIAYLLLNSLGGASDTSNDESSSGTSVSENGNTQSPHSSIVSNIPGQTDAIEPVEDDTDARSDYPSTEQTLTTPSANAESPNSTTITIGGETVDISTTSLYLYCYGQNTIKDISELAKLSNLTYLNLGGNRVEDSDLRALADLINLEDLVLVGNPISDISALAKLTKLKRLDISCKNISDISVLSNFTNLESLSVAGTLISDISVLANLRNLSFLNLNASGLDDISALSSLTNLTELQIHANNINDLTPLSNLVNLALLDLKQNNISDVSPLSNLTNLTYLGLFGNPLSQEKIDDLQNALPNCSIAYDYY